MGSSPAQGIFFLSALSATICLALRTVYEYACGYTSISLHRQELDGIVAKKEDKFPSPFRVLLALEWDPSEQPHSPGISWQNLPHPTSSPLPAFSSLLEQEETMKQFGKGFNVDLKNKQTK